MAEYPVIFYDVEYAYGSGITDISELSAMNQAEFLMNRAEYGKTLFNDDDRNLIINYASKFDNLEDIKYGDFVAAVIVNVDGELVAQELENGFDRGAMEAIREYFMDKVAEIVQRDLRKKATEFTKEVSVLTGEQADVFDKIARASGMDCWFSIGEDNSYIFDFENNEKRSLKEGIETLQEGMTSYQDYEMSAEEISVFEDLLIKLGIEPVREELLPTSNMTEPEKSLGGLCRAEIDEMGLADEVKLLGARVYGSRTREGLYHDSSDVDVVLSYTGNIREDDFFNILHEDGRAAA